MHFRCPFVSAAPLALAALLAVSAPQAASAAPPDLAPQIRLHGEIAQGDAAQVRALLDGGGQRQPGVSH